MRKVVLSTRNRGKVEEIRAILKPRNYEIISLDDIGFRDKIEETGSTFLENALIKAETVFRMSGLPVIAEDSGLCVDALGGEPGIFSSRFAGDEGNDKRNIELLLKKLEGVPEEKRKAYFICIAVFYHAPEKYFSAEGRVDGYIAFHPKGTHGFGYDPVFYLPEYKKTFAELPPEVKNRLSHRYRAFKKMGEYIERHWLEK